jgi:5'-nucleotidase
MVHSLNQLGVDVACYGNHEFDYDYEHTVELATKCNFPWLMGNIRFTETN